MVAVEVERERGRPRLRGPRSARAVQGDGPSRGDPNGRLRWTRARAARGRDGAEAPGARARGHDDHACRDRRPAADAAGRAGARRRRARRRADRVARAAGQVPAVAARQRTDVGRPPTDDGLTSPCARRRPARRRVSSGRSSGWTMDVDVAYRDVRRFGTWELLDARASPALPRRAARPRAARRLVHAREAGAGGRGAASTRQGVPSRPAAHRRDREHLRGRGALARPDPSAHAGGRAGKQASSRACTARCARPSGAGWSCRAPRFATT